MLMLLVMNACCFVIGIAWLWHHSTHVTAKLISSLFRCHSPINLYFVFVTVVTLQISHALMKYGETTHLFKLQHDW